MDSNHHPDNPNDGEDSYCIKKCRRNRCVTCLNRLCMNNFVDNHVTKERFDILSNGSCDTKNCIYVIKCRHPGCQYQYVGHTVNTISQRMSSHRSSIVKGAGCKVLKDHFIRVHSVKDMCIMPIAPLPEKKTTLKEREELEDSWMLKLNTVFPYGLNVRVKKVGILDATTDVLRSKKAIYSNFNVLKVDRNHRGVGSNGTTVTEKRMFDVDEFYSALFLSCKDYVNFHEIRTSLCNLKKKPLKNVYIRSIALVNYGLDCVLNYYVCLLIKDLSWFYLCRMGIIKQNNSSPHFCIVQFVNKFVDQVDFKKIFENPDVVSASPFKSQYLSKPRIAFKYPISIRSKVLNYREVYQEETNPDDTVCNCKNSKFIDNDHGHIITGDLSIVSNPSLRTLLQKGLNYRDQAAPSVKKAFAAIKSAIVLYCNKMAARFSMNIVNFREWQHMILAEVQKQLDACKMFKFNTVLSRPNVIASLKKLHEEFVFVPTDKASNNVTIVCKKFYLNRIREELNSCTFAPVDTSVDTLLQEHEEFLSKHGIQMDSNNYKLPYIYITPKQHKSPVGFRVITAGNSSSLQQLSKYLGVCLKSMLHSAKNRSLYDNKFHARNDFYIIDSNENVLDFMCSENTYKSFKSINTYDFSTLYTSIPHQQLKDNLSKFVERVFAFKDKEYIIPNLYTRKAYFSISSCKDKKVCFSKDAILECLFYLIDNSFVIYRDTVYRQVVGIPMGTNSGPQIADSYLHVYEHEYVQALITTGDEDSLKKLKNIFRYQDDLISFNDNGMLGRLLSSIYPPEMIINCTNVSPRKCHYLDMSISVYKGKFCVTLYDKRKDFSFNVISYPFLDGNIPTALSYGVFVSQLVRFVKVNSTFEGFKNDVASLVSKLACQGFNLAALRNKFVKFYKSKLNLWSKFGLDIFDVMIRLFD